MELSINTGVNGGAIGVDNLLYLSDKLKGNDIGYNDFFPITPNFLSNPKVSNLSTERGFLLSFCDIMQRQ